MSNRGEWIDRIRGSLAGRHSYLRGHSKFVPDALPDAARLDDFILSLTHRVEDRKLLFALYFLSQPELEQFLETDLPALLKVASNKTFLTRVERRGGGRGHVDWPMTMRLRLTSRQDPSFLVARATNRTFATPENELLKFVLRSTTELFDFALGRLSAGAMHSKLTHLRECARALGKHQYLRNLPSPLAPTQLMKVRARRNRDRRYGYAAKLAAQLEEIFVIATWSSALRLIESGYLAPVSDDDLFELFVLVQLLDVLETRLGFGQPVFRGPIVGGRDAIATFEHPADGSSVEVYFDQSPSGFAQCESEYMRVVKGYGIGSTPRRPDISLRHTSAGITTTLFLEMKMSSDLGYGRSSVYKGLGYLRDFEPLWKVGADTRPKIAIVFPSIRSPLSALDEAKEDVWLLSADDLNRLSYAVAAFLER